MTLAGQIYAQSLVLAGKMEPRHEVVLQGLCDGAERKCRSRLREGLAPEDCREDFVMAAALYALGLLAGIDGAGEDARFSVGDVSVTPRNGADGAKCLIAQAERILAPYARDGFCFRGV